MAFQCHTSIDQVNERTNVQMEIEEIEEKTKIGEIEEKTTMDTKPKQEMTQGTRPIHWKTGFVHGPQIY